MKARKIDLSVGIGIVLCGLLTLLYLIPSYTDEGLGFGVSPRAFPYICASAVTLLAGVLILVSLRPSASGDKESAINGKTIRRLAVVMLMLVFSLSLMEFAGFLVSGFFTVMAFMWMMGERRWAPLVITPVGWTLFLWLLFEKLLSTPLP